MPKFLFILLAGRLLVHLLQTLPASKRLPHWQNDFFRDLFECDLCLGVWVYFSLCCFFRFELVSWASGVYIPLVSEAITAAAVSWFAHIFTLGLKLKYGSFSVG